MTNLETERLILRQFKAEDHEPYAAIMADAEVMAHMGGIRDKTTAWWDIARYLGHWSLRGFGLWAVEEKASGALIGRIGLIHPQGWPGLEAGWLLARSHWGQGLAGEGGRAALDYAFDRLEAEQVISLVRPDNGASIRVAEKLGERLVRRMDFLGEDILVYAIDRQAARD